MLRAESWALNPHTLRSFPPRPSAHPLAKWIQLGNGGINLGEDYESTGMGVGGEGGQEHKGREDKVELQSLWALNSKSVGLEPEEAWRPYCQEGPCASHLQGRQPKPLAWHTSFRAWP